MIPNKINGLRISASADSRAENVRVFTIVIPELELVNVELEIFLANLMERSDNAALNHRPEPLDGVGMNCAVHILPCAMTDHATRVIFQVIVGRVFVCGKQGNFMGYSLTHKGIKGFVVGIGDHAGNDVALALNCTGNNGLSAATLTTRRPLIFVLVLVFPTNVGFIHLDVADKLFEVLIAERGPDLVAHSPRGFVGTKAHIPHDLQGADAFLAGQHQVHDAEPFPKGFVRVLEDRIDQHGKAIAGHWRAFVALPVKGLGAVCRGGETAARAAHNAVRPAIIHQIGLAGILMREVALKVRNAHLVDAVVRGLGLGLFHGYLLAG